VIGISFDGRDDTSNEVDDSAFFNFSNKSAFVENFVLS